MSLPKSARLLFKDVYRGTVFSEQIPNTETLRHFLGHVLGNYM